MKNKEIKREYVKKIQKLVKLNKFYYENNNPIVDDAKYDALKKDILKLESKYPNLKDKNSPSVIVGFKPSKNFRKVLHRVPMLSLANAFDKNDLDNFEKKITNYLNQKDRSLLEYSAEPKIDGISASLSYKAGVFTTGLSRGDGKEGEDITENLKTVSDIPQRILSKDFPDDIEIRGEIFIQNNDFKKLTGKFANPRNAASGSLRRKILLKQKNPLKFIYMLLVIKELKINKQSEFLKNLKWGLKLTL